ncbi:MAG: VanZ family protein [Patescibacteria group bacterium]|jgi:VanZ family protein
MSKTKTFINYYLPPLMLAGVIFYLSSIPDLQSGLPSTFDLVLRKIAHMGEYGLLAIFLLRMFFNNDEIKRDLKTGTVKHQNMLYLEIITAGVLVSLLYAFSDELHQLFVPGRSGSLWDAGIDFIGIIIGTVIYDRKRW